MGAVTSKDSSSAPWTSSEIHRKRKLGKLYQLTSVKQMDRKE